MRSETARRSVHRLVRLASVTVVATFCGVLAKPAAAGLTITTTFDSTVTSLSNAAQWESAWNFAVSQYETQFSDPININITLKAGGGLGTSSTNLLFIGSGPSTSGYSVMKADLLADSKTSNDVTAYSHLPATDPTGGRAFIISIANARALGIYPASDSATDGTVTIGSGNTYTFDPNNRAVPGAFDFIGVAEHEISEVMGRIGILGQALGGGPEDDPVDLFGYSSPGNLDLNQNQQGVYFSIDGGTTSLHIYNNHTNGGDDKDWASGQTNDSYNAFSSSGVKDDISAVDLQEMDVIGYDLIPEPASLTMLGLCSAGLLARRRRK